MTRSCVFCRHPGGRLAEYPGSSCYEGCFPLFTLDPRLRHTAAPRMTTYCKTTPHFAVRLSYPQIISKKKNKSRPAFPTRKRHFPVRKNSKKLFFKLEYATRNKNSPQLSVGKHKINLCCFLRTFFAPAHKTLPIGIQFHRRSRRQFRLHSIQCFQGTPRSRIYAARARRQQRSSQRRAFFFRATN